MLFNSLVFAVFFPTVFLLYWLLVRSARLQNRLLLVASYVFYGWWDWRFLGLIAASTCLDFVAGSRIAGATDQRTKKRWLQLSLAANLGLLGVFKYLGFFADSLISAANSIGWQLAPWTVHIVLPVGISFYTFQTLSYTIDIYRGTLRPTKRLEEFALYVAFFPQLVAGPIERAASLLPQISAARRRTTPGQMSAGVFLIVWGLWKKTVVADNLSLIVNPVFADHSSHSGLTLLLVTLAFAWQIYCDFSGYSDIARGLCKTLGFELMLNFRLPYFALNPTDFWLRWHISLSSWLRDYLYIPLGGNRGGGVGTYRNLALTMLLGGLWHGAAWTFLLWGAFHGSILVIYRRLEPKPIHHAPWDGGPRRWARAAAQMAVMFCLTLVGWVIFRAESVEQIGYFLTQWSLVPQDDDAFRLKRLCAYVAPLILVQIHQYLTNDLLAPLRLPLLLRAAFFLFLILTISAFGVRSGGDFIYFQF